VEPVTSFKQEKDMREELENIIRNLTEVKEDLDKVEAGSYGYKSAAPRARRLLWRPQRNSARSELQFRNIRKVTKKSKLSIDNPIIMCYIINKNI
jgi:hypothetical protein